MKTKLLGVVLMALGVFGILWAASYNGHPPDLVGILGILSLLPFGIGFVILIHDGKDDGFII